MKLTITSADSDWICAYISYHEEMFKNFHTTWQTGVRTWWLSPWNKEKKFNSGNQVQTEPTVNINKTNQYQRWKKYWSLLPKPKDDVVIFKLRTNNLIFMTKENRKYSFVLNWFERLKPNNFRTFLLNNYTNNWL